MNEGISGNIPNAREAEFWSKSDEKPTE